MLTQIIGKRCWRAEFSYADEFDLDIGQRLLRKAGPLRDKSYGEYQLCILADDWSLLDDQERAIAAGLNLTTPEAEQGEPTQHAISDYEWGRRQALAQLSAIVDQIVTWVEFDERHRELAIVFDSGHRLTVKCQSKSVDDTEGESMACWELYLPEGSLSRPVEGDQWPTWPLLKVMPNAHSLIADWGGPSAEG